MSPIRGARIVLTFGPFPAEPAARQAVDDLCPGVVSKDKLAPHSRIYAEGLPAAGVNVALVGYIYVESVVGDLGIFPVLRQYRGGSEDEFFASVGVVATVVAESLIISQSDALFALRPIVPLAETLGDENLALALVPYVRQFDLNLTDEGLAAMDALSELSDVHQGIRRAAEFVAKTVRAARQS